MARAVDLTGTRVATDDPVTVTLLNLAPAFIKESGMQSGIHAVLGELMAASHLEGVVERPGRTSREDGDRTSARTGRLELVAHDRAPRNPLVLL